MNVPTQLERVRRKIDNHFLHLRGGKAAIVGIAWMLLGLYIVFSVRSLDTLFPRSREMFNAARAGNRVFTRTAVVLRRRHGIRKLIIITPRHPDEFISEPRSKAPIGTT